MNPILPCSAFFWRNCPEALLTKEGVTRQKWTYRDRSSLEQNLRYCSRMDGAQRTHRDAPSPNHQAMLSIVRHSF
jgi:hypothetical protein